MQPFSRRYELVTPVMAGCLLAVSLVCWITGYVRSLGFPIYEEVRAMPLWNAVCQHLQDKGMAYLTGAAGMCVCAFLIHRANYILILIREKTLLPVLLYMLFYLSLLPFYGGNRVLTRFFLFSIFPSLSRKTKCLQ